MLNWKFWFVGVIVENDKLVAFASWFEVKLKLTDGCFPKLTNSISLVFEGIYATVPVLKNSLADIDEIELVNTSSIEGIFIILSLSTLSIFIFALLIFLSSEKTINRCD